MRSPRPTARPQAHHPRTLSRRRGSALIIVIGTLALIAVFAAIYISIGQVDRRTAATVRIRKDQADFSAFYADHIAQIIADDRLDAVLQDIDAKPIRRQRFVAPRRETTDAPYTDWSLRSETPESEPFRHFSPKGGNLFPWNNADPYDPRVASDPWLASIRPTYLGNTLDGVPRAFSGTDPTRSYLDNRDWYQISNLAPDGRFVNLVNLRNNFNAEPGWGRTRLGGRNLPRLSEGLSLFKPLRGTDNSPQFDSPIQAFDPISETGNPIWLPGSIVEPVQQSALNIDQIRNTPAVWSMYQRFSHIPLDQPFVTYNRQGDIAGTDGTGQLWRDDPDLPEYQWADADGDGFADSRWFELTAAREDQSGRSTPRTDIQRLYDAGDYRIFAAARVIDLSSLVNINVATDSLTPPTEQHPLGLTPAEVDLRRLLTMQDVSVDSRFVYNDAGAVVLSPRDFPKPSPQSNGRELLGSDYRGLSMELDNPADPASGLLRESPAMLSGRLAATAIRTAVRQNGSLSAEYNSDATAADFQLTEGSIFSGSFNAAGQQRREFYERVGAVNPLLIGSGGVLALADADDLSTDDEDLGSGLFGLDDLSELLTFHGINDSEVTTRLEQVAGGRLAGFDDYNQTRARYSPLLSSRPTTLDRRQHGLVLEPGEDPVLDPLAVAANPNLEARQSDGRIAPESMALQALSPRSLLTTVSGASTLRPFQLAGPLVKSNTRSDISVSALTQSEAAVTMDDFRTDTSKAVGIFISALAGELEFYRQKGRRNGVEGLRQDIIQDIWDPSKPDYPIYQTLFYGHRGPELALRIAAHAGLNAKDMFDGKDDTTPSVTTLILDNEIGDSARHIQVLNAMEDVDTFDLLGDGAGLAVFYPGMVTDGTAAIAATTDLDAPRTNAPRPDHERVLPEAQLPPARQAVNVYGVEPMPVITEVASMFLYNDVASSVGGTPADFTTLRVNGPLPLTSKPVTISTEISGSNADLLAQVLAIQIHNPYEVFISLGGGANETGPNGIMWRTGEDNGDTINDDDRFNPNNNLQFNYYIEFNGRFYKLGEFVEFNPIDTRPDGFDTDAIQDLQEQGFTNTTALQPDRIIPANTPNLKEFQYRAITLAPNETRVFYVMAHPRFDWADTGGNGLDRRWTNAMEAYPDGLPARFVDLGENDADSDGRPDGFDLKGWTGPAQEWIERQLSDGPVSVSRIHEFDPRTGELVNEGVFVDMIGDAGDLFAGQGRAADASAVRLWRKLTVPQMEEVRQPDRTAADLKENLIQNDLLVDRFALGDTGSNYLDVRFTEVQQQEITDTVGYQEDWEIEIYDCGDSDTVPLLERRNDNLGLSVLRWASVRRRDREANLSSPYAPGRVMPWMIQSRRDPSRTWIRSTNKPGVDGSATDAIPDALDVTHFYEVCDTSVPASEPFAPVARFGNRDPRRFDIAYSLRDLFSNAVRRDRTRVPTISVEPFQKAEELYAGAGDRFPNSGLAANTVSDQLHPSPTNGLRPEIFGQKLPEAPRIADVLLTMGVGPAYAPDITRPVTSLEFVDDEWMTLPEAMAIALGYETIPAADANATAENVDAVWYDTVRTGPGSTKIYTLDELRLSLNEFVPYLNISPDPAGDTDLFDPGLDVRRGTGAPLALGIIDQLRPFDPIELPGDSNLTQAKRDLANALNRPTMGLININTAPVEVLRLLPGLTPSAEVYRTLSGQTYSEWWGASNGLASEADLGLPTLPPVNPLSGSVSTDDLRNNPDAATGIIAYRDRLNPAPRGRSRFPNFNFGFQPDFSDINNIEFFTQNLFVENDVTGVNPPRSRSTVTGIDGLRGAPGFASLGEMMAVTIDPDPTITWDEPYRNLTMTNLGSDGRNLGVDGTGENTVSIDPKFSNGKSGVVIDDYAERLALLAGVANMTTVRSDYYAAWFVLQGFQNSDVAALRPEDPLVPSFKKRYLMVIDRSNVVEPGDAPRIVLFREVPL